MSGDAGGRAGGRVNGLSAEETRSGLAVRDLVVRRGGKAVVGPVTLSVEPGEIVALLGANGAGKSSLVEAVAGLIPSKTGVIMYGTEDLSRLRAEQVVRRGVALVPEGRQLFFDQSVEDNLVLGCYTRARDKRFLKDRLADAYERFPVLGQKQRHQAATLSGGEQQMLALSRALMSSPRVLILDEPSTGLAPIVTKMFMTSLVELRQQGIAILLVEQLVETALETADRGYVLSRGEVVLAGSSAELVTNEEFLLAYMGGHIGRSEENVPFVVELRDGGPGMTVRQ